MDNEKTISIKEEMCADEDTMFLDDPLGVFWSTECINKDVRLHFGWDENENNNHAVNTLLQTIVDAECEFCPPLLLVPKKELFAGNTLGLSWITDFIKEEPELDLEADETENIVVFSTRSAFSSTRLILNSDENCGISFEENVNQRGVDNNLKISPKQSTHFTMFGREAPGLKAEVEEEEEEEEEEERLSETKLKCSLMEKEFHKFSCSFCLQIFHSKYRLIKHVFIHISGVQSPMYVCKSCGEVFSSNVSLNKHLRMSEEYNDLGAGNHGSSDAYQNILFSWGDKVPISEQTDEQSSSIETKKHFKNSFNYTHKKHSMTPNAEKPNGTDSKGKKKIYKCDVCDKSFYRLDHLNSHVLVHSETRPHKCNICGKSYNLLYSFQKHRFRHTGKRPHKCDICGKYFIDLSTLNRHVFLHSGKRPHKCNNCGKSFPHLNNLKAHLLIHSGDRPYKCDICGKSFSFLGNCKRHVLVVHTGLRPYKCNVCGKYFTQLSSLKEHVLIHSENRVRPHKCDSCDKSFFSLNNLKAHALIHTGKKPHKCVVCGRSFTLMGHLKRHTLSLHTGIRPHK